MCPYRAKPDGNGIERNSVLKFMQCRTTIRVECLFRTERKRYGRIRWTRGLRCKSWMANGQNCCRTVCACSCGEAALRRTLLRCAWSGHAVAAGESSTPFWLRISALCARSRAFVAYAAHSHNARRASGWRGECGRLRRCGRVWAKTCEQLKLFGAFRNVLDDVQKRGKFTSPAAIRIRSPFVSERPASACIRQHFANVSSWITWPLVYGCYHQCESILGNLLGFCGKQWFKWECGGKSTWIQIIGASLPRPKQFCYFPLILSTAH